MKVLRLRRADRCCNCGKDLAVGEQAGWDGAARTCTCLACLGGEEPLERGAAGASAARVYQRRADRFRQEQEKKVADNRARRQQIKTEHPILGRLATAIVAEKTISPEPAHIRSWGRGAPGEKRVGEVLDSIEGIVALHDRKMPGGRANIDHIAVTPSGIWVIDAKRYVGSRVEFHDAGGWFSRDEKLRVAGRDRTKLVESLAWQVDTVREALPAGEEIGVHGVLCFVESTWGWFPKAFVVRDVVVCWPLALPDLIGRPGQLDDAAVQRLARTLARVLPAA